MPSLTAGLRLYDYYLINFIVVNPLKEDSKYDCSERIIGMIYGGMNATANMGNATANVISSAYGVPLKVGSTENYTVTTYNSKGKVKSRVESSRTRTNNYGGRRR